MPISLQQVEYIAHLARLELSDEEKRKLAEQLGVILDAIAKLNELDTSGVEPMVHGIQGRQPLREDVAGQSLPQQEALQNAPEAGQGFFKVPRIIE
jgi:aspartyl-tRNA(Asn)/glutamyl-tRNA(Gln) amidotransferase subunit C